MISRIGMSIKYSRGLLRRRPSLPGGYVNRSLGVDDRKKVRGWHFREPIDESWQGSELYNTAVQLNGVTMTVETTYSQAREQLKSLMDRAVDDREVIVVRRRSGGDVAMIAADELQSLMETAHLLRSAKNAERLLVALGRARSKSIKPITLPELQRQVGLDA